MCHAVASAGQLRALHGGVNLSNFGWDSSHALLPSITLSHENHSLDFSANVHFLEHLENILKIKHYHFGQHFSHIVEIEVLSVYPFCHQA